MLKNLSNSPLAADGADGSVNYGSSDTADARVKSLVAGGQRAVV